MTKARDILRNSLALRKPPVVISEKSAIGDTFNIMIPESLRNLCIEYEFQCDSKTCLEKYLKSAKDKTSKAKDKAIVKLKTLTPEMLFFMGELQKDSDTQTLVTSLVFQLGLQC